ncbi:Type I restriction modification DNA specificity domain-containing protein [Melghirimyces thermohalophilus]|uniref:Type I restriction modification DNA specificity domain-containing protein n=1 Tax=Melghirimyces thermohalophilus TaxID=1236220 RepID=A0A1G6RNB9_9BACL|nr:restriction endonuclease subunit S [Melghirimyces thermohalophilus]SDD05447.1 Type I restriction modification DNA specificity domain-containing protein [Melghirimyces thermohalophilus]
MKETLRAFWDVLSQRGLVRADERLTEALRIWLTRRYLEQTNLTDDIEQDPERLFQTMKEQVEKELAHFPGDRDLFCQWYRIGKELAILPTTIEILKQDRSGGPLLPDPLISTIEQRILDADDPPQTILITEAEKAITGLETFIRKFPDRSITLTTERRLIYRVLTLAFDGYEQVDIRHVSLYRPMELSRYNFIFSLPAFGGRYDPAETEGDFITNETEGIAAENLLRHLSETGTLSLIAPAKLTFAGGRLARLRDKINKDYSVRRIDALPEGTFRPFTSIKTYWITLSRQPASHVRLSRLQLKDEALLPVDEQTVPHSLFAEQRDWRVELFLADERADLARYQASDLPRIKLKDSADIFRGKSIMKKDIRPGEIAVLNISNLEDGEIRWDGMDTIDEEERKVKRYQLEEGDLVMTCRGTINKFAVVDTLPRFVIASANIIVIRFKQGVNSHFAKMFLESPVGSALVKSFQRGTTVMNINPGDIGELEIPHLSEAEQQRLIDHYRREWTIYQKAIRRAEQRWQEQKESIYRQLFP